MASELVHKDDALLSLTGNSLKPSVFAEVMLRVYCGGEETCRVAVSKMINGMRHCNDHFIKDIYPVMVRSA